MLYKHKMQYQSMKWNLMHQLDFKRSRGSELIFWMSVLRTPFSGGTKCSDQPNNQCCREHYGQ